MAGHAILFVLYLLSFAASVTTNSSREIALPIEVSNFLPTCAQGCFESFLQLNDFATLCGTTPSIECLCSHTSPSGFTPGEGALQCLIGEESVGYCTGNDISQQARSLAYNICTGRSNAVTPTHVTITATVIIQTRASSSTTPPTTPSSVHSSLNTSSTISSSSSKTQTTVISVTATEPMTRSTTTANAPAQQTSQAPQPALGRTFSKTQIVGIVVGGIGGVAIIAGLLVLFACLKKRRARRDRERESDMFPFQESPNSMEFGFRGPMERKQKVPYQHGAPGGTTNGIAAKVGLGGLRVPSPIKNSLSEPQPAPVNSTRDRYTAPTFTPSETSPIKVEEIGVAISREAKDAERNFLATPHQKLGTPNFERPNLRLVTPSNIETVSARTSEPRYFRPGTMVTSWTNTTVDRGSAMTIFDEDTASAVTPHESRQKFSYQNYGNEKQPEQPMPALTKMLGEGYIKPLKIRKSGADQLPRIQVNTESSSAFLQSRNGLRTAASSIYSAYPTMNSETWNSTRTLPNVVSGVPSPQYPHVSAYDQYNPYIHDPLQLSKSLGTAQPITPEPRTPNQKPPEMEFTGRGLDERSPVGKSPIGRSPVSYPKVPKRLSDGAMKEILVAQRSPDRDTAPTKQPIFDHVRQYGTWASDPVYVNPSKSQYEPWRGPEIAASRARKQNSVSGRDLPGESTTLGPIWESEVGRTTSEVSTNSMNSSGSTLMEKRRGKNGPTLTIQKSAANSKQKQTWRVLTPEAIAAAKQPGWSPRSGRAREKQTEIERNEPSTPGWKQITPTRRGDVLYLDVR